MAGLISFSHLLGWTFKHYRDETNATIIGFITGSLGVVWPWKKEIYKLNEQVIALLDNDGNRIIENYERYMPSITDSHTWIAIVLIAVGFVIVYLLDHYGNKANPA